MLEEENAKEESSKIHKSTEDIFEVKQGYVLPFSSCQVVFILKM